MSAIAEKVFVLRPAFAIALPAFGLAFVLSKADPGQRQAYAASLAHWFGMPALEGHPDATSQTAGHPTPVVVAKPVSLGPDTFALDADRGGQFQTTMLVRGRDIPVLVDTGATYVVLTYEDAASIGVHPADADFRYAAQTANGVSRSAVTTIPVIRVGNVEARDVTAFVSQPGALTGQSLLGMSFLRKLSGFEIQAGRLVLKQ